MCVYLHKKTPVVNVDVGENMVHVIKLYCNIDAVF